MAPKAKLLTLLFALVMATSVVLLATASADDKSQCFGKKPTIEGTRNDDNIQGTGNNDVIVGKGGDDTIDGGGGNDRICGNGGDDTLRGQDGSDNVQGGGGGDTVEGNVGSDALYGGSGNDVVGESDSFGGNAQQNRNKIIDGGHGTDVCFAGQLDKVRRCENFPNDNNPG